MGGDERLNNNIDPIMTRDIITMVSTSVVAFAAFVVIIINIIQTTKLNESIRITKEKEKRNRTLSFIEKFELKRFLELRKLLYMNYPRKISDIDNNIAFVKQEIKFNPETNNIYKGLVTQRERSFLKTYPHVGDEINYFLEYFDTISIFYNENNLDNNIFNLKLKPYFIGFLIDFQSEIVVITHSLLDIKSPFNFYNNYFTCVEKIAESQDYEEDESEVIKSIINECRNSYKFKKDK